MSSRIRIGVDADFRPFAYREHERPRGIVVEISEIALRGCGFEAEFIACPLGDCADAMARGAIDAFAGMAVTEERARQFNFSEPLLVTGGAWFALRGGDQRAQLRAVVTPSRGPLAALINAMFPQIAVQCATDYRAALELVIAGSVDAAALNFHVGRVQAARDFPDLFELPAEPFCRLPLALAVALGKPSYLLPQFDTALTSMRAGGVLDEIIARHLAATPLRDTRHSPINSTGAT